MHWAGQTRTHSPQREHMSRNSFSGRAPGGRSQMGWGAAGFGGSGGGAVISRSSAPKCPENFSTGSVADAVVGGEIEVEGVNFDGAGGLERFGGFIDGGEIDFQAFVGAAGAVASIAAGEPAEFDAMNGDEFVQALLGEGGKGAFFVFESGETSLRGRQLLLDLAELRFQLLLIFAELDVVFTGV